ncbi:hypothetical protein [Anaerospora hongkongensis]|uniref:hypothetical protein n=1 Tax=Anaerospora hongkongensis TaxID=244830 RepID=UPI0028976FEE|nr:hypothetical protein [Anaerospora hongkongensis]
MTIEQASINLLEAVKAIGELINDNDSSCIYFHRERQPSIIVYDKSAFKNIPSDQVSVDWYGSEKKFYKVAKQVAGIEFYMLHEADLHESIKQPLPLEAIEIATALRHEGDMEF